MLLYVASSGPVIWLNAHEAVPSWMDVPLQCAYWPLDWLVHKGPEPVRVALFWWMELWGWKLSLSR